MTRALAIVLAALAAHAAHAAATLAFEEVKATYVASDARLVDRHGAPLAGVRVTATVRRLAWTPLSEVSPALSTALVAGEDKRFYDHSGVDWAGLAVAAWDSAWRAADGRRPRGGSTLTMQLAALVDPTLRASGSEPRSLAQKWDQIEAARALERTWTKAQILEAYLNLVSYRGDLVGVRAAAQGLFGKAPSGLDARESAILVALLRAPGAQPVLVAQRACAIAVAAASDAPCEAIRSRASLALSGGYRTIARPQAAPHLAARLLRSPGEEVATTLDGELQTFAAAALRDHLAELAGSAVEDGAAVVLDNATGDVLAYVGSSGELSRAPEVDGVVAPRQAGSTLKPFLYARAIDDRVLTAASLVDDSPIALATARGVYVPQNYDRDFHGMVSVRTALASSFNVPAVRTAELIGVARFHEDLRNLGFDTLIESPDYYGASLALGGADVTLLALANAYRALANGGVWSATRVRAGDAAAPRRRVFGDAASYIVADILSDRSARAATFGLDNALATRVWSAVKTGTSKDMRDNWCVGFTSRYTVGVWVGNFSGAPMHDVSGVTGAAPVWRDIVHFLHRAEASIPPRPPAGVIVQSVAFDPAVESPRLDAFLRGTAMSRVRANVFDDDDAAKAAMPQIRYPASDTIVALDPDIPPARQRMAFTASPVLSGLRWRLDDDELPERGARVLWAPAPGHHRLVLEDASGRAVSSVEFDVRGERRTSAAEDP
ncbi:MAG TPA: penicillin-binding protein 1C [Casimicrobiaceae bacterium]|nr:penicillin-binding protein 1C [Casimicrobiaceae bacterium]